MTNDGNTSSQAKRLDMLLADYREQGARGQAPSVEEFVSRHPDLSEQLRQSLADGVRKEPSDATIEWDDSQTPSAIRDNTRHHGSSHPPSGSPSYRELGGRGINSAS